MSFETTPSASVEPVNVEQVASTEVAVSGVKPETVKTEAPKIDDRLSGKFAALSRKEKALKQQEVQLKSQASQFEATQRELADIKRQFESYKLSLKNEPFKVLQEDAGLDYEALTNIQMNEQNPTPEMQIKRLRQEMESGFKAEIAELKKALADKDDKQQKDTEERFVTNYKSQINDVVAQNGEKYELININEAQSLVFEVAEEFYKTEGRVLSIEEAADYVERHLEDEAKRQLQAKKLGFIKTAKPQSDVSDKSPSVTLSNNLQAELPKPQTKSLSREESLAEAAKLLRWET